MARRQIPLEIRNWGAYTSCTQEFTLLLSSFGYSGSNVADVMTAYYIINWEVVNGTDASKNISGIKAVRQQFATALAANADLVPRVTLLLAGLVLAVPAWPQDFYTYSQAQINSMLNLGVLAAGENAAREAKAAGDRAVRGSSSGKRRGDTLSFKRDPQISRRVQDAVLQDLSGVDPASRDELSSLVRSGALLSSFDEVLSGFGYSGTNIADVMAAYLVMSWEIVHDADASGNQRGVDAVRRNLAGSMPKNMSDADKQLGAERIAYTTALAVVSRNEQRRRGDTAALQRLQAEVRSGVLANIHIDLRQFRLTAQGFVPGSE